MQLKERAKQLSSFVRKKSSQQKKREMFFFLTKADANFWTTFKLKGNDRQGKSKNTTKKKRSEAFSWTEMAYTLLSMVRASLEEELSFHTVKGLSWMEGEWAKERVRLKGKSKRCWLGRCAEKASVPGMCLTGRWPLTKGCVKLLAAFIMKKDGKKKAWRKEKMKMRHVFLPSKTCLRALFLGRWSPFLFSLCIFTTKMNGLVQFLYSCIHVGTSLCGPHQWGADTGTDTWKKQALYTSCVPGWVTLANQVVSGVAK